MKESYSGPDFVCIGAQKAGTTWLYDFLRRQPRFWMPPEKEIHFFNTVCPHEELIGVETRSFRRWRRWLTKYRASPSWGTVKWLRRFYYEQPSTQWYLFHFPPDGPNKPVTGDMTPAYSTLDERGVRFARRVLRNGCKVFLIVRDPVERFWSGIKMRYRLAGETVPLDSVDLMLERMKAPTHRLRGDYSRIIRLWADAFQDDFSVFRYDDLKSDPRAFAAEVGAFIEVNLDLDHPSLRSRSNYDPAKLAMPPELRTRLVEFFSDEVERLEAVFPGLSDGWLKA